jgi:hypothetical protein
MKSACIFCPSVQPEELLEYRKEYLRYIVLMEARAAPRLRAIKGLWRNGIKSTRSGRPRPARMTDFIISEKLLPENEVQYLITNAPKELLKNQQLFAAGIEIPDWHDFLDVFSADNACLC